MWEKVTNKKGKREKSGSEENPIKVLHGISIAFFMFDEKEKFSRFLFHLIHTHTHAAICSSSLKGGGSLIWWNNYKRHFFFLFHFIFMLHSLKFHFFDTFITASKWMKNVKSLRKLTDLTRLDLGLWCVPLAIPTKKTFSSLINEFAFMGHSLTVTPA